MSKEKTQTAGQASNPLQNINKKWLLLLIPIILLMLILGYCAKSTVTAGELARLLASDKTEIIHLDGNVEVKEALVVNGEKTISGKGKIILVNELEGKFPDEDGSSNAWGMGCTELAVEDTDAMAAFFKVGDGATLTIDGSVKVDAAKKANAIHVEKGGRLVVAGKAKVENGRYVNVAIKKGASAEVKGGSILNALSYGIINAGDLEISGGKISGAEKGAALFNLGTALQSGGKVEASGVHNVYVSAGTFTMTGGTNTGAAKDGIVVQKDAVAEVTGGEINNCNHGLCNNGEMEVGKITLQESGIMNYKTGILKIDGTTVDVSAAYCLANNGGKVDAKNFTAKKCDTCAIYNFAGDMTLVDVTVTGSRDGNITNGGGNLTVKGGKFDKARDKSVIVGNGKAVFENVTLAGTSREKYGVYVYGGELYMTKAEVYDVSSTAFKVDTGGYVELKDVDMKDIAEIGFRTDGGKLVAENVSMENLGSHAFYNMEGEITVNGAKVDTIKKNAIQQKGGTTTLTDVEVDNIGNHTAYIELGKVVVTDSTFKNMEGNGFYLIEGENEAVLTNVTLDGVKKQGINNQSKVTIDGLTVKNAVQNGIFNKDKGTITAKKVEINGALEHGVNNYNQMTLTDSKISNTGKGSNGLQNKGTLTIEKVSVSNSKNHGVYNTGTVKGSDLTIKGTTKNGVYNDKGLFEVSKVAVSGTGEHGLNNSATMTVSDVTVIDTGKGKNSVQNAGTLKITKATLTASKNHGIYNTGTVSGKDVTIENVAKNGVYNTKGTVEITGLAVKETGEHGINNEATTVVSNAIIDKPGEGKNCIQNSGKINVTNAELKNSPNHGLYNTGTVTAKDVTVASIAKNGIYNYGKGTMNIVGLDVKETGEHGINNEATITVSDVTIAKTGAGKNSIQNTGKVTLSDAVLKDSKNHGIYNRGTLKAKDVTVQDIKKNGIYNDNKGTMDVTDVNIKNTGEHGINNASTIVVANATITTPGEGKNCIQNTGVATVKNSVLKDAPNHGLYNTGEVTTVGTLTLTNIAQNPIYNYEEGKFAAAKVIISAAGGHGINNTAEFTVEDVEIKDVTSNGIQNSGSFTVEDKATIKDAGKHGLYNGGDFLGNNISIEDSFDLSASNSGDMEIHGLTITGTAHKALYNSGYAELYEATIDGTEVRNTANAAYLVDNNGGVLDLINTTVMNAYGTALHNRGNASTSVTNVVIDKAGNFGAFVESGSVLSGDGFEINNVWKNTNTEEVASAEGMPIKNAGKITMMDHVTIGADDPEVTGSGVATSETIGAVVSNAIQNDATTAGYSGYDLVVRNVNANIIYDKGYSFITDLEAENVKDGVVVRYSGWSTLAGKVTIKNTTRVPFSIYGAESNSYKNGITIASGSEVLIEGAGSHGINNKGSFLAAADSDITIKNITGSNVNAVNNQTGATMKLGNITIEGVYTDITMYNSSTINSNCGNGIQSNGSLELNGAANISKIYSNPANNKTDNSNSSGVVVKNNGTITGTGSITLTGNKAGTVDEVTYGQGVFNGIYVEKGSIDISGDISVDTVRNQGVYVANESIKVSLKANNITVKNVEEQHGVFPRYVGNTITALGKITIENIKVGRGIVGAGTLSAAEIYVNNTNAAGIEAQGTLSTTGNVTIKNTGTNSQGLYLRDAAANVTVGGDLEIDTVGGNGIYVNNASGKLTVKGTTIVKNTGNNGINNNNGGDISAANIKIQTVGSGYNGITMGGGGTLTVKSDTVTPSGDITISNIGQVGIVCGGNSKVEAGGKVSVTNTGSYGIHLKPAKLYAQEVSIKDTKNIAIFMESNATLEATTVSVEKVAAGYQGIQLNHANTLKVGTMTIDNQNDKNGLRLYNNNSNPTVTIGKLTVMNCGEYGISAYKELTSANITVTEMWYKDCTKGAVHGNIKSGVATPQLLTQ